MSKQGMRSIVVYTGIVLGLATAFLLLATFSAYDAEATGASGKKAVIIVSELDSVRSYERYKADQFYDYLKDEGYSDSDIVYLTPASTDGRDGDPTTSNIEDAFDDLVDDADQDKEVAIYISDHIHLSESIVEFQFTDGDISVGTFDGWMDDMVYDEINFVVGGDRSGLAGSGLSGTDRTIISSMEEWQVSHPDWFNIARSLEDSSADTNGDGEVSFKEAYVKEKSRIAWTGQEPQIWES